jgi:hypothetical protein
LFFTDGNSIDESIASTDGAFGSFFFRNVGSSINKEQAHDGKSN